MSESIAFFSDRHSSILGAAGRRAANSVTQVLNLLINALGRDLLLLIGLVSVMVTQDPYMAVFGFLVARPRSWCWHAGKADQGLAHNQFTGTADILETMQESLQASATVKAFKLEQTMARAHRCQHQ